jgi:DNA polymerase-3 subunit delta
MSQDAVILKEIEQGKAAPVYLVTGEEYLARKSCDELVAALLPKAMAGLNLSVLEGVSAAEVARDLATAPMFRGRKVVVLRDPEFLQPKKGRADALSKIKDAWNAGRRRVAANRALALLAKAGFGLEMLLQPDPEALSRELELELEPADIAFLKSVGELCQAEGITAPEGDTRALESLLEKGLPRDHHLIIEAPSIDARSSLAKKLIGMARCLEHKVERELRKLDIGEAAAEALAPFKKRLAPQAESMLKDLCGGNMRLLQSELEKLAIYVGDERATIEPADVQLLVRRAREEEYRELADAIGARDLKAAIHYVEIALDQEEAPLKIHGAIAGIVRRMLEDRERWSSMGFGARTSQRELNERGIPALAKEAEERGTRVPHPYVCWLGFQACMRYDLKELVRGLLAVARADAELKSGGTGRLVLERMLIALLRREA